MAQQVTPLPNGDETRKQRNNKPKPVRWFSAADLAERFGVDEKTIWRWQRLGNMPHGIRLSRGCTRWSADVIDEWLASRSIGG